MARRIRSGSGAWCCSVPPAATATGRRPSAKRSSPSGLARSTSSGQPAWPSSGRRRSSPRARPRSRSRSRAGRIVTCGPLATSKRSIAWRTAISPATPDATARRCWSRAARKTRSRRKRDAGRSPVPLRAASTAPFPASATCRTWKRPTRSTGLSPASRHAKSGTEPEPMGPPRTRSVDRQTLGLAHALLLQRQVENAIGEPGLGRLVIHRLGQADAARELAHGALTKEPLDVLAVLRLIGELGVDRHGVLLDADLDGFLLHPRKLDGEPVGRVVLAHIQSRTGGERAPKRTEQTGDGKKAVLERGNRLERIPTDEFVHKLTSFQVDRIVAGCSARPKLM